MSLSVDVYEEIGGFPADEWNKVVEQAGAPIFYRHELLQAYERAPLQPTERFLYLVAGDRDSASSSAVLPCYFMCSEDPFRVLSKLLPGPDKAERRLLLTHMWHCYDTWLPSTRFSQEIVEAVCASMARLADECEAEWFGFINVAKSRPVLPMLVELNLHIAEMETRYLLDLSTFRTFDDYLASLKSSPRHTLQRYHRRALDVGVHMSVVAPPFENPREVVELCRASAAKHGNESYYPADALEAFLTNAGPSVRVASLQIDGQRIAAAICFLDGARFHTWAGGADYSKGERFSPYYLLYYEMIRYAIEMGCLYLEGGRRNPAFKLRHGMQPIQLYGCFGKGSA